MKREELEKRKRMYQRWTRVSAEEAVELCDTALKLMEKLRTLEVAFQRGEEMYFRKREEHEAQLTALRKRMSVGYSGNCNCLKCKSLRDEGGQTCSGCEWWHKRFPQPPEGEKE